MNNDKIGETSSELMTGIWSLPGGPWNMNGKNVKFLKIF